MPVGQADPRGRREKKLGPGRRLMCKSRKRLTTHPSPLAGEEIAVKVKVRNASQGGSS
jgi:hypothetical protein